MTKTFEAVFLSVSFLRSQRTGAVATLTLLTSTDAGLKFAAPGKERQDSVFNGLQTIPDDAALVCVHDAARPLVSEEEVYNVSAAAIPSKKMLRSACIRFLQQLVCYHAR